MSMKRLLPFSLRRLISATFAASASFVVASAQQAPASATAAQLARYDLNRNGRLDADELATLQAEEARAAAAPVATTAAAAADETVQLSPFEVRESNTGYLATNTMSGTRLNTKLEDLASSISVVTKEQMADFAMLDINDIFNYESGTEGTGNYTAFSVDRNGMVTDQIQNNPQGANRIRGIGSANVSMGNFATSGRMPIDPIAIDAVEISRGPNSNIFGLGEGSGTVNTVPSAANVSRNFSRAEARIDDLGGWRTSLDVNRVLIRSKLALRASGVYQHDEWDRKPSGLETRRFNAMLRYQPFKNTSLRAAFNSYHAVGTRATTITPRDGVSYWRELGGSTWDPINSIATVNGQPIQVTYQANGNPVGGSFPGGLGSPSFSGPVIHIDNGIERWQIGRMPADTATNGAANTAGLPRLLESLAEPIRTGHPLFSALPGVSDKSIYDYSRINLAAPNSIKDQVEISTVEFEQYLLNTPAHKIATQLAWQREDADRVNRNVIGQASATGNSYFLFVDPNSRLLDGRANPNFLRPYIGVGEPVTVEDPLVRDTYRGQLAYILDFNNETGWKKWVGRHQFLGYYEERKTKNYRYRFRDVMTSDHPVYAPAGQPKGNQSNSPGFPASTIATRPYYHFYVGDNQGYNVDYAPSSYELGAYDFSWFDPVTGSWVTDQATLGRSGITEGTAGNFAVLNLIKTRGAMMQNALLNDRIIFTIGRREDENLNKRQQPSALKPNGWEFDFAAMDGWVGDWDRREGPTDQMGIVVKPFRGWGFMDRFRSRGGANGFFGELVGGATFHYNESDSFRPEDPAISIQLNELPNPTSQGKDYGFTINLGNKFVLRANKYKTTQVNTREGQSGIYAQRTLRVDFQAFAGNNDAISLQRQARNWVRESGVPEAQVDTEVARIMGLTAEQLERFNNNPISETSDVVAKGYEFELNYNPTSFWTVRANVTKQEAIDANLSPNIPAWIAQRLPIWEGIIDPRSGIKWLDTGYTGDTVSTTAGTPRTFLTNNVVTPLGITQALEGKPRPQTREWRVNLNTSFRLAGISDNKHLKRMSVGGAVRWESKGAIGFYGIPVNGDYGAATQLDVNNPIWDKERYYFDAFASYTTRLFNDKVRARFQLNVRNIQESNAHLRAVGAYPNGRPHTFRIIDPRMFIFTTTFEL